MGDRKVMREKRTSEREGVSRGSHPVLNVGFYLCNRKPAEQENKYSHRFLLQLLDLRADTSGRGPENPLLPTLLWELVEMVAACISPLKRKYS